VFCGVLQCVAVADVRNVRGLEEEVLDYVCVLLCVAVCCGVLQFDAVCCSMLQCVAVCCSVLRRLMCGMCVGWRKWCCNFAVCGSVLLCVLV